MHHLQRSILSLAPSLDYSCSVSFFLLLITLQPLSLSCCILCPSLLSCLVLLTETEAKGHMRDPCVYLCVVGKRRQRRTCLHELAEPHAVSQGERGRQAGEMLPCCGAQPLPWWDRGNSCSEPQWHSVPEVLGYYGDALCSNEGASAV